MKRGFTLIELIVVIAIIAVLAAVVAPNAFKAIEKSKISATIADLSSIKTATMSYYGDTGTWPGNSTVADPAAGLVVTNAVTGWDGPYLEKWPTAAKWSGAYAFVNGNAGGVAATGWDNVAGADVARYVTVTLVPDTAKTRIDTQTDGSAGATSGSIRYATGTANAMQYLVSTDVSVN